MTQLLQFNSIPIEIYYKFFSHLSLQDALELSRCNRVLRAVFFACMDRDPFPITHLKRFADRCEVISLSFLRSSRFLCNGDESSFISLSLHQVRDVISYLNFDSFLRSCQASKDYLIPLAQRLLKRNYGDEFIALSQNPSFQTIVSFDDQIPSTLDHAKLLEIIIVNHNIDVLRQFVLLPPFLSIPTFNQILIDGEYMQVNFDEEDKHYISLVLLALEEEARWDIAEQSCFLDVLLTQSKFRDSEPYTKGIVLCALLNHPKLLHLAKDHILPFISEDDFLQAFNAFFSENSHATNDFLIQSMQDFLFSHQLSFKQD